MRLNELDKKFCVDMAIGAAMFMGGVFFDPIAGRFQIKHSTEGLPVLQILWCAFWAGYTVWTWWYERHYGV